MIFVMTLPLYLHLKSLTDQSHCFNDRYARWKYQRDVTCD